jgi:hypothetical protein
MAFVPFLPDGRCVLITSTRGPLAYHQAVVIEDLTVRNMARETSSRAGGRR